MKLKIFKIIFFSILLFIVFEIFLFYKQKGNTSVTILGGGIDNSLSRSVFLINDKVIDTIDLSIHYSYFGVENLSFGKNDIKIKEIETNIEYNTSIKFTGIFTWHTFIIIENNKLMHEKHYYPPRLEQKI